MPNFHCWLNPVASSSSLFICLLKLDKYRDNSCFGWEIYLIFLEIPRMFVHYFLMLKNFLYVCQWVSSLTSFLKLCHYRDISCSGWDIYLNDFGEIPGMFVHYFQIFRNILYVCHSVSWLTSFLKLDKYRNVSWSGWDIFLKFL